VTSPNSNRPWRKSSTNETSSKPPSTSPADAACVAARSTSSVPLDPAVHPPVVQISNLTADPELRFTPAGAAAANFAVASTPRKFNAQTSQWEDGDALFLRCTLWRQPAENLAESLIMRSSATAAWVLQGLECRGHVCDALAADRCPASP